jgi:gp16 family phage-associated protein
MEQKLRTPEQARAELQRKGVSVASWARGNNVSPSVVYGVLYGRLLGTFGAAHRAAVLLGLKDGEI